MRFKQSLQILLLNFFLPRLVMAQVSLGDLSENIVSPMHTLIGFVYKACYVIGAGILLGAVLQYRRYRQNSAEVPFSRPIFLLLTGIVFILLPWIAHFSLGAEALA